MKVYVRVFTAGRDPDNLPLDLPAVLCGLGRGEPFVSLLGRLL